MFEEKRTWEWDGVGGGVGKSNGNNGSYVLGFTYRFRHRMIGATNSRMLCGKSACTKCIQRVYKVHTKCIQRARRQCSHERGDKSSYQVTKQSAQSIALYINQSFLH